MWRHIGATAVLLLFAATPFEAQRGAMSVDLPALSRDGAVEEVARVELEAGLRGAHVERASALWIDEPRLVNGIRALINYYMEIASPNLPNFSLTGSGTSRSKGSSER